MTYKVSKDEIEQLNVLLEQGLDMKTIVSLTFSNADLMLQDLAKGEEFLTILTKNQKSTFFETLAILGKRMSLKEAIHCANEVQKGVQDMISHLIKTSIYPMVMFIFGYCMVLFFSLSVFPTMKMYDADQDLELMLKILQIGYSFLFFLFVLIIIVTLISVIKQDFGIWLIKNILFRFSFVKEIMTYQFAIIFYHLLNHGLSTAKALEVLLECQHLYSVRIYAKNLKEQLERGQSLSMAIQSIDSFDPLFVRFFELGLYACSLLQLVKLYSDKALLRISYLFKTVALRLQLVAYACIGVLVIVVYQILLAPLNMLQSM